MKSLRMFLMLTLMLGAALSLVAQDVIKMDGSTTVGPIAKAFAEAFMKQNKGVKVEVSESGSGNGAKAIQNGTAHIGNMSRFMKDDEFKACAEKGVAPVAHVIALDGIAMAVHPSNSVKNLTIAQIRDIYTGKITNWKEVGGANLEIVVISRDTNSGTYETFETLVMSKQKIKDKAEYVGSNGAVRSRVQSTKGAIGYIGVGFVDKTVKAVTVNGISATQKTIVSGDYPIARPLFMFTNGYPELGSNLYKLITFYLSKEGQKIIESKDFIPVTNY